MSDTLAKHVRRVCNHTATAMVQPAMRRHLAIVVAAGIAVAPAALAAQMQPPAIRRVDSSAQTSELMTTSKPEVKSPEYGYDFGVNSRRAWSARAADFPASADPTFVGPGGSPIVSGDTVFVASPDQFFYAADLLTGRLLWKRQVSPGSVNACARCGPAAIALQALALHLVTKSMRDPISGGGRATPRDDPAAPPRVHTR